MAKNTPNPKPPKPPKEAIPPPAVIPPGDYTPHTLQTIDVTALRRRIVSRYRLRGLANNEIIAKMTQAGFLNPDTREPWHPAVIQRDIQALTRDWKSEALADSTIHRGRVFAELQEIKRIAWETNDLKTLLAIINQERKLLGIDNPSVTKVQLTTTDSLERKLELLATRIQEDPLNPNPLPGSALGLPPGVIDAEFTPHDAANEYDFAKLERLMNAAPQSTSPSPHED